MKKTISALLAFLMLLSVMLPGIPVYAEDENPEPVNPIVYEDNSGFIWEYRPLSEMIAEHHGYIGVNGDRMYCYNNLIANGNINSLVAVKLVGYADENIDLNDPDNPVTVTVPDSITTANNETYTVGGLEPEALGYSGINNVTLNPGLRLLSSDILANTSVTSINIPASVCFVSEDSFNCANSLEAITVDAANEYYFSIDDVLYAHEKFNSPITYNENNEVHEMELVAFPRGKVAENFVLPEGITSLGWQCCKEAAYLTGSITVPSTVNYIGWGAFAETGLSEITVNANEVYIGVHAFQTNSDFLVLTFNTTSITPFDVEWNDEWTAEDKINKLIIYPERIQSVTCYQYTSIAKYFEAHIPDNDKIHIQENPDLNNYYIKNDFIWEYRPLSEMIAEHHGYIGVNDDRMYCYNNLIANGNIDSLVAVKLVGYLGNNGDLNNPDNPVAVTVPDSITTANNETYTVGGLEPEALGYSGINNVTLNPGLRLLSSDILANTAVTSINIPASVCFVSEDSFNRANSLEAITVDAANEYYFSIDDVLYAHEKFNSPITYNENNEVHEMELVAFPRSKVAENFVLPEGITSLGWQCCKDAAYLTGSITVPSTVNHIGWGAFAETGLSEITVNANEVFIGAHAFQTNSNSLVLTFNTTSITPFDVEWNDEWTAEDKINKLIIYSERIQSVTCYQYTSIAKYFEAHIPDNDRIHILDHPGSDNVYFDNGFIWEYVSARDIINEHYSYIRDFDRNHAYYDYVNTDIPDNSYAVRLVASDNDLDDPDLDLTVTVPSYINDKEVTALIPGAISGKGIKSVILPDTLRLLAGEAFSNTSLTTVDIPANVSFIADNAFTNIPSLTSITVNEENDYFFIYDRLLYSKGIFCNEPEDDLQYELVACPGGLEMDITDYVFPDELVNIGRQSFREAANVTGTLTIPDTVEFIGWEAFYNVPLDNIIVGTSVNGIEGRAFYRSDDLGKEGLNITFLQNRMNIPNRNDLYPTMDEDLSIIIINPQFTSSCTYYKDTAYEEYFNDLIGNDNAVYNEFKSVLNPLYNEFALLYEDAESGSGLSVVGMKGSLPEDKTIIIPAKVDDTSVTEIKHRAFAEIDELKSVTIPDTVYLINNEAFIGCEKLETVYIGAADIITNRAFADCPNLQTVKFGFPCINYDNNIFENSGNGSLVIKIPEVTDYFEDYINDFCGRTNTNVITEGTVNTMTDSNGYVYIVFGETAAIIDYNGNGGDVTVPEFLDGNKVTKLLQGAFNCVNVNPWFYDSAELTQLPFDFEAYYNENLREAIFTDVNGNDNYIMQRNEDGSIPAGKETAEPLTSVILPKGLIVVTQDAFGGNPFLRTVRFASDISYINCGFIYQNPLLEDISFYNSDTEINISDNGYYTIDGAYFISLRNRMTYAYIPSSPNATVTTIVPDTVCGVKIEDVGPWTFAGAQNLVAITIGDNIIGIAGQSMRYLPSLVTLYIGENLSWNDGLPIFNSNFKNYIVAENNINYLVYDNALYHIEYDNDEIKDIALVSAGSVVNSHLVIPDEIPGYGPVTITACCSIFRNNALNEITYGANIREMKNESIVGCYNVNKINLNEGLQFIGHQAVADCYSLTSITIPSTVEYIDEFAFWYDDAIKNVTVNCHASVLDKDYIIFRSENDEGICNIGDKPDNVVTMQLNNNDTNPYTDILLQGCLIVDNCDTSGDTFRNEDILIIGENALVDYEDGIYGSIPDAKMIPDNYRYEINDLLIGAKAIVMPETVKIIGEKAFFCGDGENGYNDVSRDIIGAYFKTGASDVIIGKEAFQSSRIRFFDFSKIAKIYYGAFLNANIAGYMNDPLDLSNVTVIDSHAFRQNHDIEALIVSDRWDFDLDAGNPFIECYALREFIIKNGSSKFYTDTNGALHTVKQINDDNIDILIAANINVKANDLYEIPNGTDIIASEALYSLHGASVIRIPATVTKIGDYALSGYFGDLEGEQLTERFEVIEGNEKYITDAGGILYEIITPESDPDAKEWAKSKYARLIQAPYATKLKEYIVPDTITVGDNEYPVCVIGSDAFARINNLEKITLSNNVRIIETWAFVDLFNLNTLEMSSNIEVIKDEAFLNCNKLVSLSIPNTVEYIGNSAFENCSSLANVNIAKDAVLNTVFSRTFMGCVSLASITLPQNINIIEAQAFKDCTKLSSVMFTGVVPDSISTDAFENIDTEKLIICFDGNVITEQPYIKNIENITAYLSATDGSLIYYDENQLGETTAAPGEIDFGKAILSFRAKITDPAKLTVNNDNTKSITVVLAPSSSVDNGEVDLSVTEKTNESSTNTFSETVEENIDTAKVETIDIKLTDKVAPETEVEPDAPVVIRLPLGDRNPETLIVYHLHNGLYEKVNHWYETIDGVIYIVFTVNSFSDFFFAAVKVEGDENGDGYFDLRDINNSEAAAKLFDKGDSLAAKTTAGEAVMRFVFSAPAVSKGDTLELVVTSDANITSYGLQWNKSVLARGNYTSTDPNGSIYTEQTGDNQIRVIQKNVSFKIKFVAQCNMNAADIAAAVYLTGASGGFETKAALDTSTLNTINFTGYNEANLTNYRYDDLGIYYNYGYTGSTEGWSHVIDMNGGTIQKLTIALIDYYVVPSGMTLTGSQLYNEIDGEVQGSDKIFAGWYYTDKITGESSAPVENDIVPAGTPLYAKYVVIDNNNQKYNYLLSGIQIRTEGVKGLRFRTDIGMSLLGDIIMLNEDNLILGMPQSMTSEIGYGTVFTRQQNYSSEGAQLIKGEQSGRYILSSNPVINVAKLKAADSDANKLVYNTVIIGIEPTYYEIEIAARPFISYVDANGSSRTFYYTETEYGNYFAGGGYSVSLYRAAKFIKETAWDNYNAEQQAYMQSIIDYVE